MTGQNYSRDVRYVAQKAQNYLMRTGTGDTAYFGPELEHFTIFPSKGDARIEHVCFVPCVDGSLLARVFLRMMHGWSVLPCVRPVDAALSMGRWP